MALWTISTTDVEARCGTPAPRAGPAVGNDRAVSHRHCRSFTNAVVQALALAWDDKGQPRTGHGRACRFRFELTEQEQIRSPDRDRVTQLSTRSAPYEVLRITTNLTGTTACNGADKCVPIRVHRACGRPESPVFTGDSRCVRPES